jgi:hypothetical protein
MELWIKINWSILKLKKIKLKQPLKLENQNWNQFPLKKIKKTKNWNQNQNPWNLLDSSW